MVSHPPTEASLQIQRTGTRSRREGRQKRAKRELIFHEQSVPLFLSPLSLSTRNLRGGARCSAAHRATARCSSTGCYAMRFPHRQRRSNARDETPGGDVGCKGSGETGVKGREGRWANGEYCRGFSMESKEESCRTKPTILPPYVRGGHTDRRDVARWDILRVSLHSGLYFANGKVRVLQLRRSGDRIGETAAAAIAIPLSLSLPPSPFSLPLSSPLYRPT